jgi:hypothetical protein
MTFHKEKRCVYIFRAEEVAKSMSNCAKNGRDNHEAENIRGSALMLIEQLKTESDDTEVPEILIDVLVNLERRSVEFFKKRFGNTYK